MKLLRHVLRLRVFRSQSSARRTFVVTVPAPLPHADAPACVESSRLLALSSSANRLQLAASH